MTGALSTEAGPVDPALTKAMVEAAVVAGLSAAKGKNIDRKAIALDFIARGVPKATCYRWLKEIMASGRPAAAVSRKIRKVSLARAKRRGETSETPAADAAAEILEFLSIATVAEVAGVTDMPDFVSRLQECIRAGEQVVQFARNPEGGVRNVRALIAGSEHLRRALDSAMKMRDGLRQDRELEAMMKAIVAEIAKESPALAERVVHRITGVLTAYGV